MPEGIEDLIRKLEPIIGKDRAEQYLQEYNNGRFNPTLKKTVECEVKELAYRFDLENQIILSPVPKRSAVSGEHSLGFCHYGKQPMNARFGLREQDFIKHVGCFGATGSGKTTSAMRIIRQLCERRKPFLIIDPKGTWQAIIRKEWAKDVKILKLGSAYAPYTFDPFLPLPGMDIDTMIAEVVKTFCDSQYLGYGAKDLLFRAIEAARKKGQLNLRRVYEEFMALDIRGQKTASWAESTQRALVNASTGILGRVLNSPDKIPFDQLMDSEVVILMDDLADDSQKAMFMGLMFNRIYWFRKLAGIKERFQHLLVMEEFHVLSKAEQIKGEGRIEFLVKMCREFSQGIMLLDQNPGDIDHCVLGNLNSIVCMNLGHTKDINAVGTAMVLEADDKRYLGRLPTGWAICRIKDRFPESVLVKVDYEHLDKSQVSPEEISNHNGDFVNEVLEHNNEPKQIVPRAVTAFTGAKKLGNIHRKMLRSVASGKFPNLKDMYLSLGLSYGRGDRIRKRLLTLGLIEMVERMPTSKGAETRLYVTERGEQHLKQIESKGILGGEWHRSAVERIASYYRALGYTVRPEYRDIDLFAQKGREKIAIEVESLVSGAAEVQAVWNIQKALKYADRVESVVKNKESAKKLRQALKKSPIVRKDLERVKIRLIASYSSI